MDALTVQSARLLVRHPCCASTEDVPERDPGTEGNRVPDHLDGSFLLVPTTKKQQR